MTIVEIPLHTPDNVLCGYRGSIAHNMYVPKNDPNHIDDKDYIAIKVGQPEHYLNLRRKPKCPIHA